VLNLMLSESESEGEIQSLNLAQKENDDAGLAKPWLHSLFPLQGSNNRIVDNTDISGYFRIAGDTATTVHGSWF
jgi:hypothetical protein